MTLKNLWKSRRRNIKKADELLVGQFLLVSAAIQIGESKTGRAPRDNRFKYGASSLWKSIPIKLDELQNGTIFNISQDKLTNTKQSQ